MRVIRPLFLLIVLTSACSSGEEGGHAFTVTEEAGVTVATTRGGPRYAFPLFELEKVLVLHEHPEVPESMLYRPTMFVRGSDGRYYVSDAGNHRIAVFGADGEYQAQFGRSGQGPGDLGGIGWMSFTGEHLDIWDQTNERVSRFGTDGTLIETVRPRFSDSSLLASLFRMARTPGGRTVTLNLLERLVANESRRAYVGRYLDTGGDTLATLQTAWRVTDLLIPLEEGYDTLFLPFVTSPTMTYCHSQGIVAYDGGSPILEVLKEDGRRRRIVIERPPDPVTAEDRAGVRSRLEERIDEAEGPRKESLRAQLKALRFPDQKPFLRTIDVDDRGYLWLHRYQDYADLQRGTLVSLLSPEGDYLGDAELPLLGGGWGFSDGHILLIIREAGTGALEPTVFRVSPSQPGFIYP